MIEPAPQCQPKGPGTRRVATTSAAVRSAGLVRFGLAKSEEPQTTRHGTGRGKAGADEQGQGGAATDAAWPRACQREDQADQGRTQGLADEPRAGENTARTARTFGRRAGKNGAVVGGLEKAEPDAADRHAPGDARHRPLRFLEGNQHQSQAQCEQADAAENAGRIT